MKMCHENYSAFELRIPAIFRPDIPYILRKIHEIRPLHQGNYYRFNKTRFNFQKTEKGRKSSQEASA